MAKKMKWSTTEDKSSPGSSASSSEDISREETATRKRRRSQARRNTSKKERSYSQGKEIIKLLCKQSKQVAESKEEMSKQMEKLREEMCESKEEICKQLEKVNQDNQEMRKQLTEILTGQRKQWDLHTNGSSGDDSDAPRSQSNPVQPPRYRLVFKSEVTDKIEKGQPIDISVALVDGNDRTVENGPLASATVELVVVNAEFNQHNNQHSWSREDFEINIKKARQGNSAAVDVDQSLKSIVSDGRFNLAQGVKCHSGSKIFRNSGNKKVRLGVMVVSPTEERVLEGLSNAFFVRGHDRDRPNRHSNLSHNRSNTQRQALVDNGCYQEQNSSMPYMQNPSWPNPTQAGGRTRQALVDNSYQVQNGQMPNLQNPLSPNSTQTGEIRLNTDTRLQLPFPGNTTMVSLGLNINGEQQPRFLGNTPMLSAEPSTSQEQRASTQYQHFPHLPMMAQAAANNQIDELSQSALFGHLRNPNYMGNSHVLVDEVGMQFSMDQRVLPVQLLWDRPNVEPSKRRWNLFDKLIMPPQEHFGSLSLASIQKSVLHTRQRSGVLIEPLEPDDSDEERPLKRKRHSKYHLRFVNKVCEAYYTRDQIKADDGNLLKVCLFDENNTKITSGPLSSASVEVVPLHGDINVDGQDYWTSEEFIRSVVCLCPPPGEEASSVLGGDRILVLAGGEACLGDAFFQKTSFCARTGKFKMGVMLASAQDERVQEGISEPFRVMDNLVKELNAKDGPTQGFNPAAATLQFPRNTVTEAIQQQALIPHQISHLKTSSGPALLLHQAHLAYSDPALSRGDAVLQAPDPEDKSKNNTPPALMPPPLVLSAAVQASTTVDVSMPKGTPIGVAAKKKGAAPAATGCIVKQKAAAATKGGQPPLSPTSPTAAAQKVQNHHLQCSLGKLESFQEQIEGLRHEVKQLPRLCSIRHADQQTRLEANQEYITANGSNTDTRLCFLNGLEPPVSDISQIGLMLQRYVDCIFHKYHGMISSKLESFQEQVEGLRHEAAQLSRLCSNHHADQQTRLEANQEHIAANGSNTNTRLCFLNGLEPPVYTDENLTSQNHAAIKLAMFEGDKVVTSGALSEAKIEILVLRGDFSNKCRDNWTEDEFDKHILQGRDGRDLVLGTVWLTNGMAELSQIRFREGSSRKNVIMAARVCKNKKTSGRVLEAVMKPVKVLNRRNKPNEKRHPPRLADDIYRLEEIARDGAYHKRLQEVQIYKVGDFLKALNEDSYELRAILKMENQQNAWSKLTDHARECVLEDQQELKRYHSKEGNVVLFFNCVHELVGAAFPDEYVACQRFNTAQKALVNKWRWHAYEKLKEPISSSTDVAAAPSVLAVGASQQVFSDNQLAPYQDLQGTGAAEYLAHDEHVMGSISQIAQCGPSIPNCPNTGYYQGTRTTENAPQDEHGTLYQIADCGPIVADPDYINTGYCQAILMK